MDIIRDKFVLFKIGGKYFLLIPAILVTGLFLFIYLNSSKDSADSENKILSGNSNTVMKSDSLSNVKTQTLQIDIQNGTGLKNISDKFAIYLSSKGYDVVDVGNFSSSDVKTSMIVDRAGNMQNAKHVALALGIDVNYVIQQLNKNYVLDATVVIGKDYAELNPFKEDFTQNSMEVSGEETNKITDKVQAQINTISAQDILDDYESNQIRADKKYFNKKIQVEGTVYKISKSPTDYTIIEIQGESRSYRTVQCSLMKTEEKKALEFSKGDHIVISGKCCGLPENLGFSDIVFLDCKIIQ